MGNFLGTVASLGIAVGVQWLALWFGRRSSRAAHWIGLVLAFVGGLFLYAAPLTRWLLGLGWVNTYFWWAPALALLFLAGTFVFDVAVDRKPDRPAIIAAFILPAVMVAGLMAMPRFTQSVSDHGRTWMNDVSHSAKR